MVRNMAVSMLKRLGFSVIEAKDGVEAVEVFMQFHDEVSCVPCDLFMPRMDGWETLAALRKHAPGEGRWGQGRWGQQMGSGINK